MDKLSNFPHMKREIPIPEPFMKGNLKTKQGLGVMKIRAGIKSREEIISKAVLDKNIGMYNYQALKEIVEEFEPRYQQCNQTYHNKIETWKRLHNITEFTPFLEEDAYQAYYIFEFTPKQYFRNAPIAERRNGITAKGFRERFERYFDYFNYFINEFNESSDEAPSQYFVSLYDNLTLISNEAIEWVDNYRIKSEQSEIFVDPWISFLGERFEFSTKEYDYQLNFRRSFFNHKIYEEEDPIQIRRGKRADQINCHVGEIWTQFGTHFEFSYGKYIGMSEDNRLMYFKNEENGYKATVKLYCGPNSKFLSADQVNDSTIFARFETPLVCNMEYYRWFMNLPMKEFENELPWIIM